MSMLVEPGTRLAGRYQLRERVSEVDGSTLWKAIDEPLARPVAVRTFTDDFPDRARVIAAARTASRITDSRFAQVFDADDSGSQAYLVSEWIEGDRLVDLLAQGPLQPQRAATFLREATAAIAGAHAAGIPHLRLTPACVLWARGGTIKITGLAIDAALHDVPSSDDSEIVDARAIGALLYAALTGTWPTSDDVGLPIASMTDSRITAIGEIRSDVSPELAAIAHQALGQPTDEAISGTLDSPAAVRDALATVPGRPPPAPPLTDRPATTKPSPAVSAAHQPPATDAASSGWPDAGWQNQQGQQYQQGRAHSAEPLPDDRTARPGHASYTGGPAGYQGQSTRGRERRPARAVLLTVVAILVLSATGLGGWLIGTRLDELTGRGDPQASPPNGGPSLQKLSISSVQPYDPPASGGDGTENPEEVPYATDGDPSTVWSTDTYSGPDLGNLKPGVGLMLDLGKRSTVRNLRLALHGNGTSVQLYAGGQAERSAMRQVASVSNAGQQVQLRPDKPVHSRYLLLWFTQLPQASDGYRVEVAEATVRGTT